MHTRMSATMRGQIVSQSQKIMVLRVTGEVRPQIEIGRFFNTIQHQGQAWFLSKNVMLNKNPCFTAPCIHVDQSLPAT